MKMELFTEFEINGALEKACEDIDLAIDETSMPSFDGFPKTRHEALKEIISIDREAVAIAVARSVCGQASTVHQSLIENFDPPLRDLAEFIAGKLRYATKEDKRDVSLILNEFLR
jgi:hypothetical protein